MQGGATSNSIFCPLIFRNVDDDIVFFLLVFVLLQLCISNLAGNVSSERVYVLCVC